MNSTGNNRRLWANYAVRGTLGATIAYATLAPLGATALAQENDASSAQEQSTQNDDDVIVVTGVKRAIQDARNAKQEIDAVSDSYFAEDIGKSSDESITDALQRIPGVTVNRGGEFGDAGTITVRGIAPELNNVTFNGVPLTSDSVDLDIGVNSQAVNASVFSADVLSRIDVIKSPSAKQEEGALGATINLYSVAPLDRSDDVIAASLQARYYEFSDDVNPRGTLSFSKTLSDRFGIAGSFFYDVNKGRRDTFETFVGSFTDIRYGAINSQTGETFEYDPSVPTWVSDPNGDGINDVHALADGFNNYRIFDEDNTKYGGTLTLQFQPDDLTNIRLDGAYSDQTLEFTMWENRGLQASFVPQELALNPNGAATVDPANGTVVRWTNPVTDMLSQIREQRGGTKTFVLGASLEREMGPWNLSARAGYSRSDRDTWFDSYNMRPQIGAVSAEGEYCGWEFVESEGESLPNYIGCPRVDARRADGQFLRSATFKEDDVLDRKFSAYLDISRELDWGVLSSVDFGVKMTDRTKDNYSSEDFYFIADQPFPGNPTEIDITGLDIRSTEDNVLGGIAPDGIGPWVYPTLESIYGVLFTGADGGPNSPFDLFPERNAGRIKKVEEKTYGAYGQLNFEDLDGRFSGNVGLRYARTEIEGTGSIGYTFNPGYIIPGTGENYPAFFSEERVGSHSYNNLLPSLNLRWDIGDELVARFSAAQTIARPALGFLAPGESVRDLGGGGPPTADGRNVELDPFKSNQMDLSLEWYFNDTGYLSAAVFHKDLKSFNYSTTRPRNFENPVTGEPCIVDRLAAPFSERLTASVAEFGCTDVLFTSQFNGATGRITGLELGYTHLFDFLPGLLRHLGVSANYTYADSSAQNNPENANDPTNGLPFLNTSKHSSNAAIFWENQDLSLRLAHSYRSKALLIVNSNNSTVFRDGRHTLDFSSVFNLTDRIQLTATANNLTDSYERLFKVTTEPVLLNGPGGETFEAPYIPAQLTTSLGDLPTDRIHRLAYSGRTFSIGVRVSF